MAGLNKVMLIGHLGRDPETTVFDNNVKKVAFTLATSETYKDKTGNKVTQTEWHNIVCWRGLADVASQYLKKGMQIYVEGRIRTHSWEDNGIKRYATDIQADTFQMLGAKSSNENNADAQNQPFVAAEQPSTSPIAATPNTNAPAVDAVADDLPF